MLRKNKVLFFGPFPDPLTGQSISFRQAYLSFNQKKLLFDTNKFKKSKALNSIFCLITLPFVFVTNSFDKVYFTSSRSSLGFLKDFQLLVLSKIFRKKVINHLHGADFLEFYSNSGLLKKIIYWSYNKINLSIVLLPSMINQYSDFKKMKIEVLSNCYSLEYLNSKVTFFQKQKQIVFLSNLIYSKGIFIFLKAAEDILNQNNKVIVKIAGKPMSDSIMSGKTLKSRFETISENLKNKFPNRFFYLGIVRGKQKKELLRNSSIYILPTFYKTEAFPISIIEAMYFGNVIITTDHNYLKDIVSKKNGFLCKPKSVNDLVNKTLLLLENEHICQEIQKHNHIEATNKYNPISYNLKLNSIILNC